MDHSSMDHSDMDHSGMDNMDHSGMDHSGMDHGSMKVINRIEWHYQVPLLVKMQLTSVKKTK